MSILAGEVRSARRAARPSVREVCLLGVARPGPGWGTGARVTLSGRVYRVEATGACSGRQDEATCHYVHLGAVAAGAD
jgi:hypothetical protein